MERLADNLKDFLTLALVGLGISFQAHDYIGGLFLALAGAAFALRTDPEQDQRELWVVILGAFLVSHVAAILANRYLPGFPIQLVMAASGFASRRVVKWAYRFMGIVEDRADTITDRIIDRYLPGQDKDQDK